MSKEGAQRRNVFMIDPDDIVVIGHDTEDGPQHYLYDERIKLPIDEAMTANIRCLGVLNPIICETDGDRTLCVDGRRRVLHAREAKKLQVKHGEETVKVPVWFKKGEEGYLFGVSRASNACRVSDGPLTNAQNAQRLIDLGRSKEEAAMFFGTTVQTLNSWLNLLSLAGKVKAAVAKGEVSISAANALAKLTKEDQVKHLDELRASSTKPTAEKVWTNVNRQLNRPTYEGPKQKLEKVIEILKRASREANETGICGDEARAYLDEISLSATGKGLADLEPTGD